MKNLTGIFVVLFFSSLTTFSQQKVNVKTDNNCTVQGVVFPKNYDQNGHLEFENVLERFTPNLESLKKAEEYLQNNRLDIKYINLGDYYTQEILGKKLCSYKRQYVGFVNNHKDSIIVIQMLNFREKRKAKKAFYNWEKDYIIAFDGFYEGNMVTFSVNLTQKTVAIE